MELTQEEKAARLQWAVLNYVISKTCFSMINKQIVI